MNLGKLFINLPSQRAMPGGEAKRSKEANVAWFNPDTGKSGEMFSRTRLIWKKKHEEGFGENTRISIRSC